MTEFEKWENNDSGCNISVEVCILVRDCSACTQLKKEGWQAALEWVLKKIQKHYKQDWDSFDITKDIQKELEQLKNE